MGGASVRGVGTDDGGVTSRPLVSVIIPTHNRAHCLPQALNSVYAQEGLGHDFDIEVIVVDDASSDATSEVISRYREVRCIRLPESRGAARAYNAGLRASKGCYISFLDDDDVWLPHKLRVQVPLLKAHPDVGVVYGQSLMRYGEREQLIPEATQAPSGWVFMPMLLDNFCGHHASLLIRREAFDKVGYFDESLNSAEDWDMSLRLAFHFPFLFAPGAVDIYNLSPHGLWLTQGAGGSWAADLGRAIEKGLQMLPDSARYAKVKREARVRIALNTLSPIVYLGDLTQAWARVIARVRSDPWILRHSWARGYVAWVACKQVLAAESPVSAARDLCAQIKAATPASVVMRQWWARRTIAWTWAEVARVLEFCPRASERDVAYAAACALVYAPWYLTKKAVMRRIAAGAIGRRCRQR